MAGDIKSSGVAASPSGDPAPLGTAAAGGVAAGGVASRIARLVRAYPNRRLAAAALAPLIAAAVTIWLVLPTLAPGVVSHAAGDSAEFQTVAWVLGTAHPTGYPSYIVLGFIATHLLPFGDPAYRMNLLQAFLAAGAVAGIVALVQIMTRMRWVAVAAGLLLLTMPAFVPVASNYAGGTSTPVFWRLATYADPHMFHLALAALIFVLLVVWERRTNSPDPETSRHADRWLVAAAGVYGVAMTNHSLTLMLAPGIALFVLAVSPRILLRWRTLLTAAAVLGVAAVLFWLELPIRAAMNAPLVYGHPDSVKGFVFVVMGKQFGGIPATFWDDLPLKYAQVMSLLASWLGPLGYVAVAGLGTSLVRRPRFLLLILPAAAMTSLFAASYANSDLERYFLVPAFVAFTLVGLGLADIVYLGAWLVEMARDSLVPSRASGHAQGDGAHAQAQDDGDHATGDGAPQHSSPARNSTSAGTRLVAIEIALAIVMIATSFAVVSARQGPPTGTDPGGLSQPGQTSSLEGWIHAVLATPENGGLAKDAVIESTWYASTALWYGQKVEGLRPDVLIVDDSNRKNDHIGAAGQVWDVFDTYLGKRPVYTYRPQGGCDGITALSTAFDLHTTSLDNIYRVVSRIQPEVSLGSCDPYDPTIQ